MSATKTGLEVTSSPGAKKLEEALKRSMTGVTLEQLKEQYSDNQEKINAIENVWHKDRTSQMILDLETYYNKKREIIAKMNLV